MKRIFLMPLYLLFLKLGVSQNVGIFTNTPKAHFNVAKDRTVLFGEDSVTHSQNKFVWYSYKGALRAGYATANWDYNLIGFNSTSFGTWSLASGINSFSANSAMALGDQSSAFGFHSSATGFSSFAVGQETLALGESSTAIGSSTKAIGSNSFTQGYGTKATGRGAVSFGNETTARAYASYTIGQYNDSIITSNRDEWLPTDPLFIIGNGTNFVQRNNALMVLKNGNVGIGTNTPAAKLHVAESPVVFVGPATLPGTPAVTPVTGAGTRMMWYADKAAFRVGQVTNLNPTSWNEANIGQLSFAGGRDARASGLGSFAYGILANAQANHAVAMGEGTLASGVSSVALGSKTIASGQNATAMGEETNSSGVSSIAFGRKTVASGQNAVAMGTETTASIFSSVVIGRFNALPLITNATTWVATDPLFVAGNGTGTSNRSNALTLLKNGNMTIAGTLTQNSDARLKTNIQPMEPVLPKLEKMQAYTYNWKQPELHGEGQIGLLAQEVERAFPTLVKEDAQGNKSVAYTNLVAVLLQAIKEQQATIMHLAKRLEAVEGKK